MRRSASLTLFLAALSVVSGSMLSNASWVGKVGMDLFYEEYTFLNSGLRAALQEAGQRLGWQVFIPRFEYCTDNAAMIGITGYHKYLRSEFVDLSVTPSARAPW